MWDVQMLFNWRKSPISHEKETIDYNFLPLFSVGFRADSQREDTVADHCSFLVKSPECGKHHLLSFKQCQQPHRVGVPFFQDTE